MCFYCTGCGSCPRAQEKPIWEEEGLAHCCICGATILKGSNICPVCKQVVLTPPGQKMCRQSSQHKNLMAKDNKREKDEND